MKLRGVYAKGYDIEREWGGTAAVRLGYECMFLSGGKRHMLNDCTNIYIMTCGVWHNPMRWGDLGWWGRKSRYQVQCRTQLSFECGSGIK